MDIARYTNDIAQATEWLGGKPAKVGWNKNHKQIAVVRSTKEMIDDFNGHRTWHRFGPIGTAWLAAMAPRMNYRYLIIQYGIQQLMEFYNDDDIKTPTLPAA